VAVKAGRQAAGWDRQGAAAAGRHTAAAALAAPTAALSRHDSLGQGEGNARHGFQGRQSAAPSSGWPNRDWQSRHNRERLHLKRKK